MSGGGSGSGGGGGFGSADDCTIVQPAKVASPDRAVIGTLKKGDRLKVALIESNGPDRVELIAPNGRTAGGVAFPYIGKLIACMKKGFKYDAIVQAISGASIDVEIRNS